MKKKNNKKSRIFLSFLVVIFLINISIVIAQYPPSAYVAYWKLDSQSGGITPDETGNNPGTLTNGAKISGKSAMFDGDNDYINTGNNFNLGTSDWAISFWINQIQGRDFDAAIAKGTYNGNGDILIYDLNNNNGRGYMSFRSDNANGGAEFIVNITSSLARTGWRLVTVARDDRNISIYLDGKLNNSKLMSISNYDFTNARLWTIGARQDGTQEWINASIDEVLIYNKALTEAEIQELYRRNGCNKNGNCETGENWINCPIDCNNAPAVGGYDSEDLCMDKGFPQPCNDGDPVDGCSTYVKDIDEGARHGGSESLCEVAGNYYFGGSGGSGTINLSTPSLPLSRDYVFQFEYNIGTPSQFEEHFTIKCGTKSYEFPDIINEEVWRNKSVLCDFNSGVNYIIISGNELNNNDSVHFEGFRIYEFFTGFCGNGILEVSNNEECDDNNNRNGDGCSSSCKIESAVCETSFDSGRKCMDEGYSALKQCTLDSSKQGCSNWIVDYKGALSHSIDDDNCAPETGTYSIELQNNFTLNVTNVTSFAKPGRYIFNFSYLIGTPGQVNENFSLKCGNTIYNFPDIDNDGETWHNAAVFCNFSSGENYINFSATGLTTDSSVHFDDFRIFKCGIPSIPYGEPVESSNLPFFGFFNFIAVISILIIYYFFKRRLAKKLLLFTFVFLLLAGLASADFSIGDKAGEIEKTYEPSGILRGWLNISLDNEKSDSLLTAFESNITILNFLNLNNANYSCFPKDCESAYSILGTAGALKKFFLEPEKTKLLGIRLTGEITDIKSISFNALANSEESCLYPLKIDILNDNLIEWAYNKLSNTSTCISEAPYGCFNIEDSSESTPILIDSSYCEKINLPSYKGFEIGADLIGTGNSDFRMSINAGGYDEACSASASQTGKISCVIEFPETLENYTKADVCIEAENLQGSYSIKYEDKEPCGYSGNYEHDFQIFAKPLKYSAFNNTIIINQELIDEGSTGIELAKEMSDYIGKKYNNTCTPECIIPIKFYAGSNSDITSYNLSFAYEVKGLPKSKAEFNEIQESKPVISSNFLKLNLEKANFLAPSSAGNKQLSIKLGDKEIISTNISISSFAKIIELIPQEVPALVPVKFKVFLESNISNLSYSWNFGDGYEIQTDKPYAEHVYKNITSYSLSVKISNKQGQSKSTFQVNVISPKDSINSTIKNYEENLKNIESQINNYPELAKNEISEKLKLEEIKKEINSQKKAYSEAIKDEEYMKIIADLLKLEIPYEINISQSITSDKFFPNLDLIDFDVLEKLGAGKAGERKEYINAINSWLIKNLVISFDSETYSIYFKGKEPEELFSYVKLKLKPGQTLNNVHLVFDEKGIKFKDKLDTRNISNSVGIVFQELSEKTIEFIYPKKIDISNFPFYISPELGELELGVVPGACNNNGKCEKEQGENYKNCGNDCNPVFLTYLALGILIFLGLIVYIMLQQWYKRHYESKLFPNRNNLFNLINYIYNCEKQGISKSEMFSKLKKLNWGSEQIKYAWRKFKGKRTGMWEIPVFRGFEIREVKSEIAKRQASSYSDFQ